MTKPTALSRLLPEPGRIVADLTTLDVSAYDQCAAAYADALRALPGVQAIARFGGVSLPGVSDLDLLVVVDDDALPQAVECSARTIASLPHGPYLIWHAPALVPLSLLPEALALHSFENLQPLHGPHPATLLTQTLTTSACASHNSPPLGGRQGGGIGTGATSLDLSAEFRALRTLLWNSFFWRAALSLPRATPSLRFLLLTAGNFAQSAAHTLRVLGNHQDADSLLTSHRQRRMEIAQLTGGAQARAMVELLSDLLTYGHDADWRLQAWWEHQVRTTDLGAGHTLALGHDALVRFARVPDETPIRLPWMQRLNDLRHRRPARAALTLPTCYLHLSAWLQPHLTPSLVAPDPAQLPPAWRSAVEQLRGHLTQVIDLLQRRPDLPRQALADVFVAPFAQTLAPASPAPMNARHSGRAVARLARQARQTPRHQPGVSRLPEVTLRYTDLASLHIEYKDIFHQHIYRFTSATPAPRILDGGGCIGVAALYFKHLYPQARITTFEPDPQIARILRHNLTTNGAHDVEIIPAGLAGFDGEVSFAPDGVDGGRITPVPGGSAPANSALTRIAVTRLAHYVTQPIDLLKLNIEGQELDVLTDLQRTERLGLVRNLILEYHGFAGGAQKLGPLLSLLDQAGFRYLVHDFDHLTNGISKPPFVHRPHANWFCLVHARNLHRAAATPVATMTTTGTIKEAA